MESLQVMKSQASVAVVGVGYWGKNLVRNFYDLGGLAALCDALWQRAEHRAAIERNVLAPLRARQHERLARSREETAATKVDFFTLVRGDN